ncbi:N-6 DNA methylase [Streptomyces sp. NBC_00273]|uniref:N-6 DNA methylase n=1 Tax=Streptomyces sp. NBC_00273 TaxID=2903644 RepID=UPI002E2BBE7B|nr:N-6 DNA methylase [Streptomyces sp. NBC_00273]
MTLSGRHGSSELRSVWRALDALCAASAPELGHQLALQVIFLRSWPAPDGAGLDRSFGPAEPALNRAWALLEFGRLSDPVAHQAVRSRRLHGEADRALAALIAQVARLEQPAGLFDACLDRYSSRFGAGGDYYTPRPLARLMAGLAAPQPGESVLDPVCGSGRLLVAADEWARGKEHGPGVLAVHGRDIRPEARRAAAMNLTLGGLHYELGGEAVDSLHAGPTGLSPDVILANPPLNTNDWGYQELIRDPRWSLGPPPKGNANFAWLQHVVHELSAQGRAVVLLPDSATRGLNTAESYIRRRLVERDLLAGVVALPSRLFPHTRSGATLWLLARDKSASPRWGRKSRVGEVLLADARRLGTPADRAGGAPRADAAIDRIWQIFANWRGTSSAQEDGTGQVDWCRSVNHDDIARRGYDLSPGSYVQTAPASTEDALSEAEHRHPKDALYEHFEHALRMSERLREVLGTEPAEWVQE